jgi:hypothetical protein
LGDLLLTKFAVEGVTEALAKELAPLGIFATTGTDHDEVVAY